VPPTGSLPPVKAMKMSSRELVSFVTETWRKNGKHYSKTADELGVAPATVWKLVTGKQQDSDKLREALGIAPAYALAPTCSDCGQVHVRLRCPGSRPKRPYPPTLKIRKDDVGSAASSIREHYNSAEIERLIELLRGDHEAQ
jgi:hypothetical protein